jgi:putative restriction endonuclease
VNSAWIFQGNPQRFDLDGYFRAHDDIVWLVQQAHLAPEMQPGDRVFFWRSGTGQGRAGVIAAGRITAAPTIQPEQETAKPFWSGAPEELAERLRARIRLDPERDRFLGRDGLEEHPVLGQHRIFRMRNETNYRLSGEEAEALETLWSEAGPRPSVGWLLASFGEDRQHAGNTGYDDDPERVYRWDSKVPNSKQIQAGDVVVVRSDVMLGIARIERIDVEAGTKELRRCPVCTKTTIKERLTESPRYRCHACKATFDEPQVEIAKVTKYAAHYASTFLATPDALPVSELRAACPKPNDNLAMQRIALEGIVPLMQERYPAITQFLVSAPRQTAGVVTARDLRDAVGAEAPFDPSSIADARLRTARAIAIRQGQPEFRARLLQAYGGRCAITGCDVPDALEAAHILGYRGQQTNHVQNGLLLRADLHTLFDRGLLSIDAATWTVVVHASLRGTHYGALEGVAGGGVSSPTS